MDLADLMVEYIQVMTVFKIIIPMLSTKDYKENKKEIIESIIGTIIVDGNIEFLKLY